MATVSVYNMEGKEVGTMELNDAVFGAKINEHLVHMSVVQYLANKRQGTQKAKTRSEVSGGGRKPWRQKGTGHARQGSIRAPQWKGGGVVFAPTPRDYSFKLNKKEKAAALKSALTSRLQENKLFILEDLVVDQIKTKTITGMLKGLGVEGAFVVTKDVNQNVYYSTRNIPKTKTGFIGKTFNPKTEKEEITSTLNVYDVLKYKNLVITKAAVELIEEVYA